MTSITADNLAEETLRESEERYQTLLDSIDEAYCVIEMLFDDNGQAHDYRFLEVNDAFVKMTGWHQVVGTRVREWAPQHEEHWFKIYGHVALTGEPIRFTRQANILDARWFDLYAFRIGGADSRNVAVLFSDITKRKQAIEALAEERAQFNEIIELAPSFMCVLRGPEFVFEVANEAYRQLTGHRELIGLTARQAFPEVAGQGFFELLERVYTTGEPYVGNSELVEIQRQPGAANEPRYLDFIYQPLRKSDGSITGVFAHGVDITGRKQNELLQASQQSVLELSARGAPLLEVLGAVCRLIEGQEPGLLCSILLTDESGRHTGAGVGPGLPDEFVQKLEGINISPPYTGSCCEALNSGCEVVVPDIESDQRWSAVWRDLNLSYGLRACRSIPILGSDGTVLASVAIFRRTPGDPGPTNKQLLGIATHLASIAIERSKAEERERTLLLETALANAQFRAFFEQGALFAGIMRTDGTMIEPNRLCLEACGYTREQVVGKLFWDCPWWNRSPALMQRIQQATAQAATGETFREELPYFVADGSERLVDLIVLPVKDAMGRVMFLAPTGTDITDRKLAENALKEADRRKDEFLATLAHELRNPLAPIRNGLQIMRLSPDNPQAVGEARTMMERQLEQMVHLVDDLLDLSRISRGQIELRKTRIDLVQVVRQAIETSRPAIEQGGHELALALPTEAIYIEADITRLAQVFSNLLNNAAKYTEQGGRIRLSVQRQGEEAIVSVRDNGIGIPKEMLPKVFDIFTQVDRNLERSQGGLGIGLSIVKRLVEMHGGKVEGRSEGVGQGSEFIVRLPVLESTQQLHDNVQQPRPAAGRRRILVVDDNRDAAISLAMMLKLMGNETKTAHDGFAAIDVAAEFRPDLILLDIGMPRLNGYDTARKIREQPWGEEMTLVALTGWGQEEDRRKSQAAGFNSHIVKPIEMAAIEKLLAELNCETAAN